MKRTLRYIAAAFNAKPFGMPIPPNWFALAAVAMAGWFINPGFWLIGGGLEIAYLWWLSRNPRFRKVVDARSVPAAPDWTSQRNALMEQLAKAEQERQEMLEARCADLARHLTRLEADPYGEQAGRLANLAWLHLRLLVARKAIASVAEESRKSSTLQRQTIDLEKRLAATGLDEGLRRSLEGQLALVRDRIKTHQVADQRLEFADAELERIRQQVELAREQGMLATDAAGISRSVDVLAASVGEAGRWLRDQREVLSDVLDLDEAPPAESLFRKDQKTVTESV